MRHDHFSTFQTFNTIPTKYDLFLNCFVLLSCKCRPTVLHRYFADMDSIKPQRTFPKSLRRRNDHLSNFPRGDPPAIIHCPRYNINVTNVIMHPRKQHPEETHDEGNPDTTFRCSKSTILNTLMIKQMFNINTQRPFQKVEFIDFFTWVNKCTFPTDFNSNLRYFVSPAVSNQFHTREEGGGRWEEGGRPPRRSLSPNLLTPLLSVTRRKQPIFRILFNICIRGKTLKMSAIKKDTISWLPLRNNQYFCCTAWN